MGWTFDPLQLAAIGVAIALYALAVLRLRRRRKPLSHLRVASFVAAILALVFAVISPLDSIGESRLFTAHMAQHLLIGDLAPLFAVCAVSGPLLRPVLAFRVVRRLRGLAHPLVALPLWAVDLCGWHLAPLYDAALDHPALHAAQHVLFFTVGCLLWSALLQPLPGPRAFRGGARIAALGFVWAVGAALSNVFLWAGHPYYDRYAAAPQTWGLSALSDQRIGGGLMLLEMTVVVVAVFVWLGVAWLREPERRQRVLELRSGW
jgi:putative membrane protein